MIALMLFVTIFGFLVSFLFATSRMEHLRYYSCTKEDRRRYALQILTCWAWPVWMMIYLLGKLLDFKDYTAKLIRIAQGRDK